MRRVYLWSVRIPSPLSRRIKATGTKLTFDSQTVCFVAVHKFKFKFKFKFSPPAPPTRARASELSERVSE